MNTYVVSAVRQAGSQQALAQLCGVSQAAVSKWLAGGTVSPENARRIERATGGQVRAIDLRPDVFGDQPLSRAAA